MAIALVVSAKYRAEYIKKYAFPGPDGMQQPDTGSADQRFLGVMANRVPDGVQLYKDLQDIPRQPDGAPNSLPGEPAIAADDLSKVWYAAKHIDVVHCFSIPYLIGFCFVLLNFQSRYSEAKPGRPQDRLPCSP